MRIAIQETFPYLCHKPGTRQGISRELFSLGEGYRSLAAWACAFVSLQPGKCFYTLLSVSVVDIWAEFKITKSFCELAALRQSLSLACALQYYNFRKSKIIELGVF
jgi:hypothetical protein